MHQAKMFGSWRLFKQIETHHISHMYDRFDRVSMSRFFMTEMRSLELRLKQAVRKRGMELDPQDSVSRFWNMEHDVFVHTHATSFSGKGPVSLRQGNCCRSMSRRRPAMRVKEEIKGLAVRLCKRLALFHSNDFVKSWEASRLFSLEIWQICHFHSFPTFPTFPPIYFSTFLHFGCQALAGAMATFQVGKWSLSSELWNTVGMGAWHLPGSVVRFYSDVFRILVVAMHQSSCCLLMVQTHLV